MFFAINFLILFELINLTLQDVYLHNPRGSNNRLNEKSAARTNGNRLFDSQVCRTYFELIFQKLSFFLIRTITEVDIMLAM